MPILVVWFGIGVGPAVLTAFLISFFPITVNIATGLATLEPELEDVLRVLGAQALGRAGQGRPAALDAVLLRLAQGRDHARLRRHHGLGDDGRQRGHRLPADVGRLVDADGAGVRRAGRHRRRWRWRCTSCSRWSRGARPAGRTGAPPHERARPSAATPPPPAPPRIEPTPTQVLAMLERAQALARRAMDAGHHPFGALLVAADHETVLHGAGQRRQRQPRRGGAGARARRGASRRRELWACTLVTTVEPCAMCAGTQYWANIGRLVFGIEEKALLAPHRQPRREPDARPALPPRVRARPEGRRVIGPVRALAEPIAALHRRYWRSK